MVEGMREEVFHHFNILKSFQAQGNFFLSIKRNLKKLSTASTHPELTLMIFKFTAFSSQVFSDVESFSRVLIEIPSFIFVGT